MGHLALLGFYYTGKDLGQHLDSMLHSRTGVFKTFCFRNCHPGRLRLGGAGLGSVCSLLVYMVYAHGSGILETQGYEMDILLNKQGVGVVGVGRSWY